MSLSFSNKKEVKCIQQIDDFVVSIVEKHSDLLLNEYFTKQELYDEHVFMLYWFKMLFVAVLFNFGTFKYLQKQEDFEFYGSLNNV